MIQLPQSTIYGKRMPKEKFYSHLNVPPSVKKSFVEDIDYFIWHHKLSAMTLNVAEGEKVKEIAVFDVYLKRENYNPVVFELIDKNVPVYALYVLHHDAKVQLLTSYKEPNAQKHGTFKIMNTFTSDWLDEDEFTLQLSGFDLDAVYESYVRQIAGAKLQEKASTDIVVDITEQQRRAKIERQIAVLENKRRNEPQFNKQIVISAEIKKLRKQI